jgi:hypothetical protein
MIGPIRALVWECWRLSRQELMLAGLSLLILCLLFLSIKPSLDPDQRYLVAFMITILLATLSAVSFGWTRGFNANEGFLFSRHFAKPISTRLLVLTPLLTIIAKSFLTTLVLVGIFQFVADLSVPLVPLSIGVALVSGLMVSISWSIISMRLRVAVLLIPLALAFLALITYVGNESRGVSLGGSTAWTIIKWNFYLLGGLGMLAAMPLVVRGVESQRHVFGLRSRMGLASKEQTNLRPARLVSFFRNSFSALIWHELRVLGLKTYFWAATINLAMALILIAVIIWDGRHADVFSLCFTYVITVTCTSFLVFAVLGSAQSLDTKRIPQFQGAKPISNQQLAFAKLTAVLVNLLIGCLIGALLIFAFLITLGFRFSEVPSDSEWIEQVVINLGWQWSWLVALSLISISTAIGVISFSWILYGIRYGQSMLICLLGALGVFALAVWDGYNDWQHSSFWLGLGFALTSLAALIVFTIAFKTIVSRQIDALMAVFVLAMWIVSLALFYAVSSIAVTNWSLQHAWLPVIWFIIATWIPAGLTISLPWIVARLRHVD